MIKCLAHGKPISIACFRSHIQINGFNNFSSSFSRSFVRVSLFVNRYLLFLIRQTRVSVCELDSSKNGIDCVPLLLVFVEAIQFPIATAAVVHATISLVV